MELTRGTPVLLQLYVLYFGLAPIIRLGPLTAAILGLGLNYAAYEAEVQGQVDAEIARSGRGGLADLIRSGATWTVD